MINYNHSTGIELYCCMKKCPIKLYGMMLFIMLYIFWCREREQEEERWGRMRSRRTYKKMLTMGH